MEAAATTERARDELRESFAQARAAVSSGDRTTAVRVLSELEAVVMEEIAAARGRSHAVADANAQAVEMLARIDDRKQQLEQEVKQLGREHDEAKERCRDLSGHVEALQAATVESVLMLDDHENQLAESKQRAEELEVERQAMERRAVVDDLTGLYNHRYLKERLASEVSRAVRYGRALSVLFIDVDHFKLLNDNNGHQVGDAALRAISDIAREEFRGADVLVRVDGTPFVARYGGEELVAILPETDNAGAAVAAERLRSKIRAAPIPGSDKQPSGRVTVSIGVAELNHGEEMADLLRRADEAVYRAKAEGRDRVVTAR